MTGQRNEGEEERTMMAAQWRYLVKQKLAWSFNVYAVKPTKYQPPPGWWKFKKKTKELSPDGDPLMMKSLPVFSPERVDGCFAKGELLIFTVALKLYRLPQVKPCVVCSLLIKSGKRACLEIIIFVFPRSCCLK